VKRQYFTCFTTKMGKYFNPANADAASAAGGILLNATEYRDLMRRLPTGYALVGRFNRGLFYLMPLLPNEDEYNAFMRQYNEGSLLSYEFYAMPNSVFGISVTSDTAASVTSGVVASVTSGTAASVTSDEACYEQIVRINAMMTMKAGLVATCRYCKSESQSGQKCPKNCGGYCI
jgi:hypothetical protein